MVASAYINRSVMTVFTVALAVILLIAVGERFTHFLEKAALGQIPSTTVLTVVILRLPEILQLVIPFALYFALLLGLGRLYASQEMVILQSAGMTPTQVLRWLSPSVLGLALAVAAMSLALTPYARQTLERHLEESSQSIGFAVFRPGIFHSQDNGQRVTYAESTSGDGNGISNVFVSWSADSGEHTTIWAARGEKSRNSNEQPVLSLFNGHRYIGSPGQHQQQVASFAELHIPLEPVLLSAVNLPLEAIATGNLGSSPSEVAEFHWRLALPLFVFIAAVLAIANATVPPRQNPFVRLLPALGWIIAYYLALVANRWAISEAAIPLLLGFWPSHAVFAVAAAVGIHRLNRV
jgi:lipopolysaccharide export system permease protein